MAFKIPDYIISKKSGKILSVNAYDPSLNEYSVRDIDRQISITIKVDRCRCATDAEVMEHLESIDNSRITHRSQSD